MADHLESPEPTLRHALRHVNRVFQARLRERLGEYGVSEAEYMAMFALRRIPDMSNADLSRWTGVTAQGANQVLKSLIEAGFVERRPSPSHARILQARLTEEGEKVIEACEQEAGGLEDEMCEASRPARWPCWRTCCAAVRTASAPRSGLAPRVAESPAGSGGGWTSMSTCLILRGVAVDGSR